MGKRLSCRDVGVNCDFEIHAKTEAEVLQQAAEHAKGCHQGVVMTPALQAKIKAAIKDEGSSPSTSLGRPSGGKSKDGSCCGGSTCH